MNYVTELSDWLPLLGVIVGGLIVYLGQRAVNAANATSLNVETWRKLLKDVGELSEEVNKLKRNNTALWQYIYTLLDHFRKCGEAPPLPPIELESDPQLMAIINQMQEVAG